MSDIEIEIDGKTLKAKPNQTVIQVADEAGIYIPRFCYHKHLSIPANCRMCLVEVEKAPKALPACATPVMPGMKVFTKSARTIAAQRAVMEFLLINHPLDCPICDQGGECELQDLAMGYGSPHSHYNECKRAVPSENLGPLVATEMTRCIQCTRCVRFGDELAGLRELGIINRGEDEAISTYVEKAMVSEVSGNIIDLCPVGALTSKPFRFRARAWELQQAASISPHDCVGSNLEIHTRYGQVLRAVPRENKRINDVWIADRDRFSYEGLYHDDRLKEPLIKKEGVWQVVDWQTAFAHVASRLNQVMAEQGPDKIGALASPSSTVEEFYLLQKIIRGLGSSHVDHRLREIDTQDQASFSLFPGLDIPVTELRESDAILLIGANTRKAQPMLNMQIRKAALKGAAILAIQAVDYRLNFPIAAKKITAPHYLPHALASIINAIESATYYGVEPDETAKQMAAALQGKQKAYLLLGEEALHHPQAAKIRYLAKQLAQLTGAKVGFLTEGANQAGAWLAGAVPHRAAAGETLHHTGLSAYEMLHKPRQAYLLLNIEPEKDTANAALAMHALKQAKFVVALSIYRNPVLEEQADVILPMAPFTETAGTFVNVSGEWQSFHGVAGPYGASRPAWKILRVLGNFLQLDGFEYESADAVRDELKALLDKQIDTAPAPFEPEKMVFDPMHAIISRVGNVPLYAVDSIVRRSAPLQAAQHIIEGDLAVVKLHPETAAQLQLQPGDKVRVIQSGGETILPVTLDERIACQTASIAGGIAATSMLGDLFGKVELERV